MKLLKKKESRSHNNVLGDILSIGLPSPVLDVPAEETLALKTYGPRSAYAVPMPVTLCVNAVSAWLRHGQMYKC